MPPNLPSRIRRRRQPLSNASVPSRVLVNMTDLGITAAGGGTALTQRVRAGDGRPKKQADRKHQPPQHIDITKLLRNREFIKVTAFVLPHKAKFRVLELMERLRQQRVVLRQKQAAKVRLPEMTGGELVREINWRVGTLPPDDAEQLAEYIRRLTRWRAARTRQRAQARGVLSSTAPGAGR